MNDTGNVSILIPINPCSLINPPQRFNSKYSVETGKVNLEKGETEKYLSTLSISIKVSNAKPDIYKKFGSFRQVHADRIPAFANFRRSAENRRISSCGACGTTVRPEPEATGSADIRQFASNAGYANCLKRESREYDIV